MIVSAGLLILITMVGNLFNWWTRDLLFVCAIGLAVVASVLYFNVQLNKLDLKWQMQMPKIQIGLPDLQVPESLQDDVDDIRYGRITGTQFAVISSLGASLISLYFLSHYEKWTADWRGFNVILVAVLVSVAVAFLMLCTEWFHDQEFRTPMWIFLVVLVGLVLCIGLGIYMTEPMELGGPTAYQTSTNGQPAQTEYDYSRTRAHGVYINMFGGGSTSSSGSSSSPSFNCSGKGCEYVVLVIILIIVILVLIACSAFIAHFWVLASLVLCTIMVMIAIHELRVNESRRYGYRTAW
jgi:MFS family permease